MKSRFTLLAALMMAGIAAQAQNPIIRDQFSADPSALVVGDRVYVFPSHDIKAPAEYARKDWFCMADYHVFSSSNLTDWTDHGMIVDQWSAPWVNEKGYSMWAPDCKQNPNNGKYYFFFPAGAKPQPGQRFGGGNRVGICTSDYPEGPYTPEATPIEGVGGIDPCIFVDDDGQAYLVMPTITIYKLNPDWKSISTDPADRHRVEGIPTKGLVEGPYLYKHGGKYYMTFPWARDVEEVLAYCVADNIFGPYEFKGVFFEEHANKCWTNHHSIIEFKGQTYLFYHHNEFSPEFDKNRSVCADSIFFDDEKGEIKMVKPTLRGIGVTQSNTQIQLDRYTALSASGDSIAYLEPSNYFAGWKTVFYEKGAWAKYNTVEFKKAPKKVTVKVVAPSAGKLEILQGDKVISTVEIPADRQLVTVDAPVKGAAKGVHNLKVRMITDGKIQVDWLTFN